MEYVNEVVQEKAHLWPQILIMEDEVNVGKGLEMVLSEEGYAVDLALTGQSAIETFDQKEIDLVIADLRLPDIDGMDVIKRLKGERPETGVIVITGYSTIASAIEATRLGVSEYLSKPFTSDEFMLAVSAALTKRKKSIEKNLALKQKERHPSPLLEPLPEDVQNARQIALAFARDNHGKADNIIPMLQKIQSEVGYIPQAVMEDIAEHTKTSPAAVYGIATFYEQFRLNPGGRHTVKVCRGTACHVKGAERILTEIESSYQVCPGETSADRSFTLETVACFGSCAIAPVVVVDDEVKAKMTPGQTRNAMDRLIGSRQRSTDDKEENRDGFQSN